MNVSDRIKERRKSLGLTQPKLAELIGVSLDMIKSMEVGRTSPSIDTLSKLSDVLGCTTDYLLGKSEAPQNITWTYPSREEFLQTIKEQYELTNWPEEKVKLDEIIKIIESLQKDPS